MTCEQDIAAVNEVKPDFAGFVIEVPGRRRSLSAEQVKVLVKGTGQGNPSSGSICKCSSRTTDFFIKRWNALGGPATWR